MENKIKLFEDKKIRVAWDQEKQDWYFSIVDVVAVLNDSDYQTARTYWSVLKVRLKSEGYEPTTNCSQLKLPAADGNLGLQTLEMLRLYYVLFSLFLLRKLNLSNNGLPQ